MVDDLNRLSRDIEGAPKATWPLLGKALATTALRVKESWAENLGGRGNQGSSFRHVAGSVDFDLGVAGASLVQAALGSSGGGTGLEAEIGPNLRRKQGAMAGWFEEGMRNIPAVHAGHAAMKANEGDFEEGIQKALDQGLKAVGL